MMFLIRRHLVSVELNAYKAKMTGQSLNESPTQTGKASSPIVPTSLEERVKGTQAATRRERRGSGSSEQVGEPTGAVAEPSETVTEPAEEAAESDDQDS